MKKHAHILFAGLTGLVLLFAAPPASAQMALEFGGVEVDTNSAIEVTAESLRVDQATGRATFDGDVLISQGDMRLGANTVDVVYSEETGEITELLATGNVLLTTPTDAAEAQTARYNVVSGQLTLTGDVLLTQGPSAISAESMDINVNDGSAVLSGRVSTVLQPQTGDN